LKGSELKVWFSFIPLDVRLELFNAELNSLSGEGHIFQKCEVDESSVEHIH
jgi:hypothetical protein